MSDDKKKKKKWDQEVQDLIQLEKETKLKKIEMKANCKHFDTIKGKKSYIVPTTTESVHICERCKTTMDLRPRINGTSNREINEAIDAIVNELQIWKYQEFVNPDDDKVKKISDFACKLHRDILVFKELKDSYDESRNKKNKKKRYNNNEDKGVRVGTDALKFNERREKSEKKSW